MHRAWTGPAAVAALPDLLGRRVTLRHRLPDMILTDAVGELADAGPGAVTVHTRRGPVRVATEAVVAVREVPPPRPKRPSWAAVARLERVCADGWPAVVDRPLGDWRLRAAGGFTGRANSALAVGDPGMPVPEALDRARAFAAEHGVPPRVQVPEDSPWHTAIAGRGWVPDAGHAAGWRVEVLVSALSASDVGSDPWMPGPGPPIADAGRHGWAVAAGPEPGAAERHVLSAPGLGHLGFLVAGDGPGSERAGSVRVAVVDGHLYVTRLAVDPGYRRRGLARRLMAAASAWGRERGARWSVLQVAEHNTAALELYAALGHTRHHRYLYLVPPEA